MNRKEMIEELLERLEYELDELNNSQLELLLAEYEHGQMLSSVIENLSIEEDSEDEEDEEDVEPPYSNHLIDGEWDEEED